MNEEEKKALKVINTRTKRLLNELEIEKEDMSDEPKIAYLMQEIRANKTILNLIEKLQKENELAKKQVEYDKTHICTPQIIKLNYIPIQKIKDKIEELYQQDKNWSEEMSEPDSNFKNIDRNLKRIKNQIDVLQELIEESEEK